LLPVRVLCITVGAVLGVLFRSIRLESSSVVYGTVLFGDEEGCSYRGKGSKVGKRVVNKFCLLLLLCFASFVVLLPKASKMMLGLKIGVAERAKLSSSSRRPKGDSRKASRPRKGDSRESTVVLNGSDHYFEIRKPACKTPNLPFRSKRIVRVLSKYRTPVTYTRKPIVCHK
jgi:hypothetical protein